MLHRWLAAAAAASVVGCWAEVPESAILPTPGAAVRVAAMQRALLVDVQRIGKRLVAVGDHGYVVFSDDEGANWRLAKAPPAPLLTAVAFLDERTGLAVGHDSVILATGDGGETWTRQFSAPAEQRPLLDVAFIDKSMAFAVGAYGAFYESGDGGKSWSARKILNDDKHLNAIVKVEGASLLILGEAGTILASDDAGKSWQPVASPYKGSLFGALVANDGAVIAYGLRGRVYRSTDKGRTWKQVDHPGSATLMGGVKLADGALVIVGAAGTAIVSRDNGQSFVPLATGSTKALSGVAAASRDKVLLVGEGGAREVPLPTSRALGLPQASRPNGQ